MHFLNECAVRRNDFIVRCAFLQSQKRQCLSTCQAGCVVWMIGFGLLMRCLIIGKALLEITRQ